MSFNHDILSRGRKGISPVIATILLISVVAIAGGVIAYYVSGLGVFGGTSVPPTASAEGTVYDRNWGAEDNYAKGVVSITVRQKGSSLDLTEEGSKFSLSISNPERGWTASMSMSSEKASGNLGETVSKFISEEEFADGIVISEIYPQPDDDANSEFIELYNPYSNAVDLEGWWLYNGNSWKHLQSVAVNPDHKYTIPAHGFFLITDYGWGDNRDNLDWPISDIEVDSLDYARNDESAKLRNEDNEIIDSVYWGSEPGSEESWERKAEADSTRSSMRGDDSDKGNAYDTDSDIGDSEYGGKDFVNTENTVGIYPMPENSKSQTELVPAVTGAVNIPLSFDGELISGATIRIRLSRKAPENKNPGPATGFVDEIYWDEEETIHINYSAGVKP